MFGWGNGPDVDTAPKRLAVADYFSVIGLDVQSSPEVCEPAKHGLAALSKARKHFVADCIIVNTKDKETVPTDYEPCEPAINGNLVCVRRCGVSPRDDYIIDLSVVERKNIDGKELVNGTKGSPVPLKKSRRGKECDRFLAVTRAEHLSQHEKQHTFTSTQSPRLGLSTHRPPGVKGLCVIKVPRGESCAAYLPLGYRQLKSNLGGGKSFLGGKEVYIAIATGPSTGVCDVPFLPQTIDRYPVRDHHDFPLPTGELPMFCFPHGLYLQSKRSTDAPLPSFFSFVFTNMNGERIYVACLCFYEKVPEKLASSLRKKFRDVHRSDNMDVAAVSDRAPSPNEANSDGEGVRSNPTSDVEGEMDGASDVEGDGLAASDEQVLSENVASMMESMGASVFGSRDGMVDADCYGRSSSSRNEGGAAAEEGDLADTTEAGVPASPPSNSGSDKSSTASPFKKYTRSGSGGGSSSAGSPPKGDGEYFNGEYCLFMPKCICLISHYPFYRGMRRFLRQLYSISLSASKIPLERYISYFVSHVPFPKPGGATLHVHLDGSLMDSVGQHSSLPPIILSHPALGDLPSMDLDFLAPFRCLSIANVINIFALMLLEGQMLFVSSVSSLITEVMETLRQLIFPMAWQSAYVPRLPDTMSEFLGAPGGFMIGMHLDSTSDTRHVELRYDLFLDEQVYVIALDTDSVSNGLPSSGKKPPPPPSARLPSGPLKELERRLETICKTLGVSPGQDLQYLDAAFEFAARPDSKSSLVSNLTEDQIQAMVRGAFLQFMVDVFYSTTNFRKHLVGPAVRYFQPAGGPQKGDVFDMDGFLAESPATHRAFLDDAVQTQMFSCLVHQHLDEANSDHWMVFVDQVDLLIRNQIPLPKGARGAGPEDDPVTAPLTLFIQRGANLGGSSSSENLASESPGACAWRRPGGLGEVADVLRDRHDARGGLALANGPTSQGIPSGSTVFTYTEGWPTPMEEALLAIPDVAVPQEVKRLQLKSSPGLMQGSLLSRVRSRHESVVSAAPPASQGQDMAARSHDAKAKRLALHIYGCYLLATPTLVSYEPHHAANHVLRALGMLQDLEDSGVLHHVDEAMWRGIIMACGRAGGDTMREIAVCVFNSMKAAGITNPNPVSFGQCMKVSSDSTENVAAYWSPGSAERKRYRRLEDAGWNWCQAHVPCLGGTMPGSTVGPQPLVVTEPLRSWVDSHHKDFFKERMGIGSMLTMDFFASSPASNSLGADGRSDGEVSTGESGGEGGGGGEARGDGLTQRPSFDGPRESPTEDGSSGNEGLFGAASLDMWTENVCPACRRPMLDEEVMASWRDGSAEARIEDCRVTCPSCRTEWYPELRFSQDFAERYLRGDDQLSCGIYLDVLGGIGRDWLQLFSGRPLDGAAGAEGDHEAVPSITNGNGQSSPPASVRELDTEPETPVSHGRVAYLGSHSLRTVVEELLLSRGEGALEERFLRRKSPPFYFNMLWYCHRLGVPVPWVQTETYEIVASFSGDFARARAQDRNYIMYGSPRQGGLPLGALFPRAPSLSLIVLAKALVELQKGGEPAVRLRAAIECVLNSISPARGQQRLNWPSADHIYFIMLHLVAHYAVEGFGPLVDSGPFQRTRHSNFDDVYETATKDLIAHIPEHGPHADIGEIDYGEVVDIGCMGGSNGTWSNGQLREKALSSELNSDLDEVDGEQQDAQLADGAKPPAVPPPTPPPPQILVTKPLLSIAPNTHVNAYRRVFGHLYS